MNILIIFFLMFLLHVIDDFGLQLKSLSVLKQKQWWEKICMNQRVPFNNYQYDYIAALIIHGLSWSIMVHLPIMIFIDDVNMVFLSCSIICNAICHSYIDDLKANKMKINLCIDQLAHLIQIILILINYILWK